MGDVTYKIFPSIGIARVGNSPDDYYIGPVTAEGLPILPGDGNSPFQPADFRDAEGRLKRQAARFHIYRCAAGEEPTEITLDTPGVEEITWTVHLANKKASWYEFQTNRGETGYASNHPLRNAAVTGADRYQLIIDAGPRSISGSNESGPAYRFDREHKPEGYPGSFPPEDLEPWQINTLGEVRTDSGGRVLVLGGHGHSGSTKHPPAIQEYANNNDWWDDTSDGSVTARIRISDETELVEAAPAWVVVGPPSYAPQIANLVSLYDTIFDTSVRNMGLRPDIFENQVWKSGPHGYRPHFETEIRPLLQRGERYPWVAAIPPKAHRFDWTMLGDPDPQYNGYRAYFLGALRGPGDENTLISSDSGVTMMPYLAGDDALGEALKATSKFLKLTDTQYFMLEQWASGWFVTGDNPRPSDPGYSLTQGVLENCVGGAFSPGIEMTWISRNPAIYSEPFRLKLRPNPPEPLSLSFDPAAGMEPGDATRYMAVPWQADFNECSSQPIEDRILWWWPPQRPNFVYLEKPITGTDVTTLPFPDVGPQVPWVGQGYDQNGVGYIQFSNDVGMVENWDKLGFVYNKGTEDNPRFVEVARTLRGDRVVADEAPAE